MKKSEWQREAPRSVAGGEPHKDVGNELSAGSDEAVEIRISVQIGGVKGQSIVCYVYGYPVEMDKLR